MNPSNPITHLMLVAGEASGDMHAAHLVEEIKKLDPAVKFSGLGGPKMQAAGVEIYSDLTRHALIGFVEVIKHYDEVKKDFDLILKKIREQKPTAVILVDYPGFNLRLAPKIKKLGVKVIYYISPQVWAWKENRVKAIRASTDKMLVLFEFEKEFYAKHKMTVDFVGHPLVDSIKITQSSEHVLQSLGLSPRRLTIGILPGSRKKEIETILPVMMDAVEILNREYPAMQFILIRAASIDKTFILKFSQRKNITIKISDGDPYSGINACDVCMVASGTATLETAILEKPMVVVYKTSFLTWALAKMLIKIPYIGLVNVVAGEKIVPECVQFQATGKNIALELRSIFTDDIRIENIKFGLKKIKDSLGAPGASRRAAEKVIELIKAASLQS